MHNVSSSQAMASTSSCHVVAVLDCTGTMLLRAYTPHCIAQNVRERRRCVCHVANRSKHRDCKQNKEFVLHPAAATEHTAGGRCRCKSYAALAGISISRVLARLVLLWHQPRTTCSGAACHKSAAADAARMGRLRHDTASRSQGHAANPTYLQLQALEMQTGEAVRGVRRQHVVSAPLLTGLPSKRSGSTY